MINNAYDPVNHPSRRDFLFRSFNGIGGMALGAMLADDLLAAGGLDRVNPLEVQSPNLPGQAKNCIFLFMQGGVSHVDSFDYKPMLNKYHGQRMPKIEGLSGEIEGRLRYPHGVMGSRFSFSRHGECGRYIADIFPNIATHADNLAFVYGAEVDNQNHGPATLHVTTGDQFPGSPSVGSWVNYGLGSPNQNMPGYAVIQDQRGSPVNGAAVWGNGYLPAAYQGTLLRAKGSPILNLKRPESISKAKQRREFDLIRSLNEGHRDLRPEPSELDARIQAYELAYRMQTEAPEILDIGGESEHVRTLYGLDKEKTAGFGRQCLLARRLVEKGVRFTMLVHGVQISRSSWDDHGDVHGRMLNHSAEVDQPVAALLTDLKQRGLLDDTLVVWATEMGRTPFKNGKVTKTSGRDHNGLALCMWMAGGNVKGGATAGMTDDFGLRNPGEPIHIRDVHATILRLMGIEDTKLTYLHAGRFRKLTDIGGKILHELIA